MKKIVITCIKRTNIIQRMIKILFYIASTLPIRKKTVVFESFLGKQYSDNPKAIYKYMKKNFPDYKLYWSFDRKFFTNYKNQDIQAVSRLSIKWIFIMARAEYWVTNSRLPQWIPKRLKTTYVQTWHGTPLKKLGADIQEVHMPGTTTEKYKKNFIYEANKWDYLISPNAYSTEIFRRAFAYNNRIIETGYPRNDILFTHNNEQDIASIKNKLNIPLHKKVMLYAPTWRDDDYHSVGKYKLDLQLDLSVMKEKLGEDYILLLRTHYLIADNIDLTGFEDFVYDFSYYGDISELYLVSDLLVTDYSSVFFDFANLQRPILFFVYDIDQYREKIRGFYFEFEKYAPGPLVKTTDELITELKNIERKGYAPADSTMDFMKRFCYLENGESTKRVVNKVFLNN